MCNLCWQRHPDRPRIRTEGLIATLDDPPEWLRDFAEFAGERHCPSRACVMITRVGRLLQDGGPVNAQALLERSRLPGRSAGPLARALEEFFVGRGLAFGLAEADRLARGRRDRRVAAVPESLRPAVADYSADLVDSQKRALRTGTHPRSDNTIESSLAIVRDFARFVIKDRFKGDWAAVDAGDVETFLVLQPANRSRRLGALRGFFRFARRRKLVLIDPTAGLARTPRPAFQGRVLAPEEQRRLFRRWTSLEEPADPYEALIGVLALVHAASNSEVRSLRVADIDQRLGTLCLDDRPHPLPIDPITQGAIQRALAHRKTLGTKNPHVIVTRSTKTRSTEASPAYVTHALDAAGVTTKTLRQTRIIDLVTSLDPKVAAEILGMNADGLARYLADGVNAVLLAEMSTASNL